jgi:nucleoside-diphosphate kinase
MAARTDDSLLFVVEWYDPMPQMKRQYLLKYFTDQHMAEMVDLKTKKMFLKKSPCPSTLTKEDFFVGSKILLYSRELEIVDYGDLKTKERFQHQVQPVVLLLPAASYSHWGKILDELIANNEMNLIQAKTIILSPNMADKVCGIVDAEERAGGKKSAMLSEGVTLALLLHSSDSYGIVASVANRFQQQERVAIITAKNGLQSSDLQNMLFTGDSANNNTATLDNCTCCIVKPHAVKSKLVGAIMDQIISQGYEISALRSLYFDKTQAEEFLEVYKGVVPEYPDHVMQLCGGLSVAMEIRAQNAVETFRVTAGPWDVEMAKELRPDTIRGKFGVDRIRNAIHCTDLAEDAELECEYCFKLL